MRLSLLLFFLLGGLSAYAQKINVGLRASGNYYMQRSAGKPGIKAMDGTHMSVAPEAFVRYQTKGRWAAEFAVNTQRIEQRYWWTSHNDVAIAPPAANGSLLRNSRYIDATLSLQREIRCSKMTSVPGLKNLHTYIGVTAGLTNVRGREYFVTTAQPGKEFAKTDEYWYHWIGLMKTVRYDVNNRFSVIGAGQCDADPGKLFGPFSGESQPCLRFSLKLGASYNW